MGRCPCKGGSVHRRESRGGRGFSLGGHGSSRDMGLLPGKRECIEAGLWLCDGCIARGSNNHGTARWRTQTKGPEQELGQRSCVWMIQPLGLASRCTLNVEPCCGTQYKQEYNQWVSVPRH